MIMIPEQIKRAHVHQVVQMETTRFVIAVIPPEEALVLHFRQASLVFKPKPARLQVASKAMTVEEHTSTVLADISEKWSRNWHDRITWAIERDLNAPTKDGHTPYVTDFTWPNRGLEVRQAARNGFPGYGGD